MKKNKAAKMKAVRAWALVSIETGEALRCDSLQKVQRLAKWMTAAFGPVCRIARVSIREVPK